MSSRRAWGISCTEGAPSSLSPYFPVAGGRVLQVSKLHVVVSWGFMFEKYAYFVFLDMRKACGRKAAENYGMN